MAKVSATTTLWNSSAMLIFFGSRMAKLRRTVGGFPPWEVCMAPSSTMKTSPRGGGIQESSSSRAIVLCVFSVWCPQQWGHTFHFCIGLGGVRRQGVAMAIAFLFWESLQQI